MRLYFFGNLYLSSIQQGIQSLHATVEMFLKYDDPDDEIEQQLMLMDWAANHKTVQLMNGGYGKYLHELHEMFEQSYKQSINRYPYAKFHEEQDALDGAITSVAILLPARVYLLAKAVSQRWTTIGQIKQLMSDEQVNSDGIDFILSLQDRIRNIHESYADFDLMSSVQLLTPFDLQLIEMLPTYRFAS